MATGVIKVEDVTRQMLGFWPDIVKSNRHQVVRTKCEPCKGTGRMKRKPGQTYRTMSDGRRGPRCSHCMGFGYQDVVVKQ